MTDPGLYPFNPDWTVAPAGTLRELIEQQATTPERLAGIAARRFPRVTEKDALAAIRGVLNRQPYDGRTAAILGAVTGTPAMFWVNLEANYRADLAAGKTDTSEDDDRDA